MITAVQSYNTNFNGLKNFKSAKTKIKRNIIRIDASQPHSLSSMRSQQKIAGLTRLEEQYSENQWLDWSVKFSGVATFLFSANITTGISS